MKVRKHSLRVLAAAVKAGPNSDITKIYSLLEGEDKPSLQVAYSEAKKLISDGEISKVINHNNPNARRLLTVTNYGHDALRVLEGDG